jgi:hypothetical protein
MPDPKSPSGRDSDAPSPSSPRSAGGASAGRSDGANVPLQIALRVLIGFGGLALLVGFFLPWLQVAGEGEALGTLQAQSGLTLAMRADLVGTPAPLLFLVPALGIVITAVSFMGFKWSGQVAVGVALGLIGYSLYVLLQMFVQHTALGLWIVSGSVFLILLLGVIAWMTGREHRKTDATAAHPGPADELTDAAPKS